MGGRTPYSIKEVVGEGRRALDKRNALTKSLREKDIDGIVRSSVKLIPEHRDIAKIYIYSKKLLSAVKGKYPQEELKELKGVVKKVRVDWTEKKKKEKLISNRVIDIGVVDAVSRVLKKRIK